MSLQEQEVQETPEQPAVDPDYEEFEIGEHQVPWFLWVFFTFIILWASISWIAFFGY